MRKSLILLVAAFGLTVAVLQANAAQGENQAGLVVRFDDGRVETRCVSFAEGGISGYELLQRSAFGLEIEESGAGVTVCSVDGVGCPASNCFCRCQGSPCEYWSYWHLQDGQWRYSAAGASTYEVGHGDVDGWSWGPGSVSEAIPPPAVPFEEICATEESADASAAVGDTTAGNDKPVAVVPTGTVAGNVADEAPAAGVPWSYAVFGALVAGLLAMIVWSRRKSP